MSVEGVHPGGVGVLNSWIYLYYLAAGVTACRREPSNFAFSPLCLCVGLHVELVLELARVSRLTLSSLITIE